MNLGVNIDHVATLRQARYRDPHLGEPCPLEAARLSVEAGAHGITAHLREDRRHIQDKDIERLREAVKVRFNFEMADTPEMRAIALRVRPDVVCVVPEKREELTTEGGLDVVGHRESLSELCASFSDAGIEVSMFIDPVAEQVEAASQVGSDFVELHTGRYAECFQEQGSEGEELERLRRSALMALNSGLRVNAGHGLNYVNVGQMALIPGLEELNIGHSIVSRAVVVGMPQAVREMLAAMSAGPQ